MKKFLGAALSAAIAFCPGLAGAAELFKNLKVDGSLETQAISARNVQFLNTPTFQQEGDAQTRVLVNLGWDLLDDVHANVTAGKNNRIYGNNSTGGNQGETITGIQGAVAFDQANVKIDKLIGNVDAKVGRQFFGTPGDLVAYFGPKYNLYGLAITAIDAARFDWANDMVGITGIVGKIFTGIVGAGVQGGSFTGTDSGGTQDLRGLIATFKGTDSLSGGLQLYNRVSHNSIFTDSNRNDYLWVAGAKAKWTAGGLWVKGEVDKNFGEDRNLTTPFLSATGPITPFDNYTGWAFLINAGYKADLAGFGGVTPWAELGDGSGGTKPGNTFQAIAGDYRPGGIYGLFAPGSPVTLGSGGNIAAFPPLSSNTLGNRFIWGIGVKAAPSNWPKITTGLSYWDYHFQTTSGTSVSPFSGRQLAQGNKHLGSEVDINVNYNHSDNVSTGITIGQFWTGGAVKSGDRVIAQDVGVGISDNPATLFAANLTIKY